MFNVLLPFFGSIAAQGKGWPQGLLLIEGSVFLIEGVYLVIGDEQ